MHTCPMDMFLDLAIWREVMPGGLPPMTAESTHVVEGHFTDFKVFLSGPLKGGVTGKQCKNLNKLQQVWGRPRKSIMFLPLTAGSKKQGKEIRMTKTAKEEEAVSIKGDFKGESCVCLNNKHSAFSPCFHLCVCEACSASVMGKTRECPLCCSESRKVHTTVDNGAANSRCLVSLRMFAVTSCFHR